MAGTETKAQRVERLKRELNPWEAYAEIQRFAREGWDAIPPEWLGTYFRWWGIYTQGDGIGAIGGKGGEGKATRHFMVRIRIPNGQLQAHQLRTIAGLAERYARGIADITVRQNIQLHWVTLESLPDVFQTLWRTGITTMGACGDVTRNVTGCPLAGVDADEIVDASPLVHAATRMLNGNPAFYNLPRKYKVSITGCRVWCAYPEINDVGLTALHHEATGELGFAVRVGGGLSTDPRLATRLDAFVRWHEALPVLRAISEIPRLGGAAAEPREGPPQVPLPPARLDRGEVPRGDRGPARRRPRARGARRSAGRRLPRPRGSPSPEAGGVGLRGRRDPARPARACRDARRRGPGGALRYGRAQDDQHAEPPDPARPPRARGGAGA